MKKNNNNIKMKNIIILILLIIILAFSYIYYKEIKNNKEIQNNTDTTNDETENEIDLTPDIVKSSNQTYKSASTIITLRKLVKGKDIIMTFEDIEGYKKKVINIDDKIIISYEYSVEDKTLTILRTGEEKIYHKVLKEGEYNLADYNFDGNDIYGHNFNDLNLDVTKSKYMKYKGVFREGIDIPNVMMTYEEDDFMISFIGHTSFNVHHEMSNPVTGYRYILQTDK